MNREGSRVKFLAACKACTAISCPTQDLKGRTFDSSLFSAECSKSVTAYFTGIPAYFTGILSKSILSVISSLSNEMDSNQNWLTVKCSG